MSGSLQGQENARDFLALLARQAAKDHMGQPIKDANNNEIYTDPGIVERMHDWISAAIVQFAAIETGKQFTDEDLEEVLMDYGLAYSQVHLAKNKDDDVPAKIEELRKLRNSGAVHHGDPDKYANAKSKLQTGLGGWNEKLPQVKQLTDHAAALVIPVTPAIE